MDRKAALERAIELTDEILGLLENGEIEQIWQLELARQPLIKQGFTSPIEQIDLIRARHLQALNQQVVDRLSLFKTSILEQQKQLRKGAQAARAYTNP